VASPIAQLHILLSANATPAVQSLRRVDSQLRATTDQARKTDSQFKQFAKGAAAGFGIGAAAVGISRGARAFVGFDRAMRNVNSLAQLSEKQLKSLSDQVLELAGPTAQAPQTLAEGLYDLVSSGFDANEAVVVLGKSAKAATAGMTDTATAAKVIAASLNAYGLEAEDAGRVSDILFRTVDQGVVTFEELAQQIGPVLPSARALGVTLTQVGAAMATLTKQGFPAAEAATAIDATLRSLFKPSEALKKSFKELGVSSGEELIQKFGSLQKALTVLRGTTDGSGTAFRKLFNEQRAGRGVIALTGDQANKAAKDLKTLADSAGSTDRAFREMEKSVSVQLQRLQSDLESIAIRIGGGLLPVIRGVVSAVIFMQESVSKSFKAVGRFLTTVWNAPAKAFGDFFASIYRGFARLFDLGSKLPIVGDKFDGLADKANRAADSIDKMGEQTQQTGRQARGATGIFSSLERVGGKLASQFAETSGRTKTLRNEINRLPARKEVEVLVDIGIQGLESASNFFGSGGGDGWGIEKGIDKEVERRVKNSDPMKLLGAGGGGGFSLMGANANLAPFAALGSRFGLQVTSGLRPGSITDSGNLSYHASGRALDIGGSTSGMLRFAKVVAALFGSRLKELIHTPLGFAIKDGQRVAPYAQADHYDHVHVAMQTGGTVVPGSGSGDKVPVAAMLEPGERFAVMNRNAARAWETMNGMFPRFQKGGGIDFDSKGGRKGGTPFERSTITRDKVPGFAKTVWKRLKALGGRGFEETMPRIRIGGPAQRGGVSHFEPWNRTIPFGNTLLEMLADPAHPSHLYGLNVVVHEMAHAAQPLGNMKRWEYEGGASAFSSWAAPLVYRGLGIPYSGRFEYPAFTERVRKEKPLNWIRHGQFIGRDTSQPSDWAHSPLMAPSKNGASLLTGLDKVFPAHYLGQPGRQFSSDQVRAIAEKWGGLNPARALQADQITLGESSRHPGIIGQDPGGTLGIGLWQITRGVQGALGKSWIDARGGDTGMRNPRKNAEVMSIMSGKGSSWSNWYGTRYLQPIQQNVKSVFDKVGQATGGSKPVQKIKRKAQGTFSKIKGIDLGVGLLGPSSKQLNQRIKFLTGAAEVAGEFAARAEQIDGKVNGKDQTGWLNDQLAHLFALRNTLIDAEKLVARRRNEYADAVDKAEKRLKRIAEDMRKAERKRKDLVDRLRKERKRPKPNKRRLRQLGNEIDQVDRNQRLRVAARNMLKGELPGWRKSRNGLTDRRGELLTSLQDVQGIGSPMNRMVALPQVGVLGGQIFDVQMLLKDAAERVTDTNTPVTDTTRADLLARLLREANQRTAVSEQALRTFSTFDRDTLPFLGGFAKGGVALVGERGPELAHLPSGTRVHSADDTRSMLQPNFAVVVHGDVVNVPRGKQPVEVINSNDPRFRREVGRSRVGGTRPLPGRGGGLRRG
jgi:TP901 family phage tail tape measure protein